MAVLTLAWSYLIGRAAASDWSAPFEREWPPHPDRVFQALVAAWGNRGMDPAERSALEWLESLPPPAIFAPEQATRAASSPAYVPVNDRVEGNLERKRFLRSFPATRVTPMGISCALIWSLPKTDDLELHRPALTRLATEVTCIGHSSSLVRMWLADDESLQANWYPMLETQRPMGHEQQYLRIPVRGRLRNLVTAYEQNRRPTPMAWCPYYKRVRPSPDLAVPESAGKMVILRQIEGEGLPPQAILNATHALRATLVQALSRVPPQLQADTTLISGHEPDGRRTRRPHVAYVGLPFAGTAHADGHLLGLALVLPRDAGPTDEELAWQVLGYAADTDHVLRISVPGMGILGYIPETRPNPPYTLRFRWWCQPADCWATITPVVLDRHPTRTEQRALRKRTYGLLEFAGQAIRDMCKRSGLPDPTNVVVSRVSIHRGVPHVREFPPLSLHAGGTRPMVHAWIRFPRYVQGPLLLGAGRYKGYGLFLPVRNSDLQPRGVWL